MPLDVKPQMTDPDKLRRDYVARLYRLADGLASGGPDRVAEARRTLAHLRRSLTHGLAIEAYEFVFRDGPPDHEPEQTTWLLVGGLFGLHPMVWRTEKGPRSLGASLGTLDKKQGSPSIGRRLNQLLARNDQTLPYHLRHTIRLLSANAVPVHYGQLLDDLVVLLGRDHRGERANRIRLKWAREFHLPVSAEVPDADEKTTEPVENTT
jgi:CRISPR system Cascade subunit CasB